MICERRYTGNGSFGCVKCNVLFNTDFSCVADDAQSPSSNAVDFLNQAATTMAERGKQYDQPTGERSMARTVAAFNAITGQSMSESDGWLFMLILKQTRQWSTPAYHEDSAIDSVAYAALLAESLASGKQ